MVSKFFSPAILALYEIIWKNMVEPDRPQISYGACGLSCLITKTTDTHSVCVILVAFPLQQWLRELSIMLRLYVHYLSY